MSRKNKHMTLHGSMRRKQRIAGIIIMSMTWQRDNDLYRSAAALTQ